MKHVTDLLHEADPLRHEPDRLAAERERLRRTVVGATSRATHSASRPPRRTLALAAAILLVVAALITVAGGLWSRGSTTLQAAVLFDVRLAEEQPADGLREARVGDSERFVYLHPETVVSNSDIADSRVDRTTGAPGVAIVVEFTVDGARRMEQATADHIARPVAILVDGEVVMAAIVQSPIGSTAVITGAYTEAEAERIAAGIRPW